MQPSKLKRIQYLLLYVVILLSNLVYVNCTDDGLLGGGALPEDDRIVYSLFSILEHSEEVTDSLTLETSTVTTLSVLGESDRVYTSGDGLLWSRRDAADFALNVRSAAGSSSGFIGVGFDGAVYSSTNLKSWNHDTSLDDDGDDTNGRPYLYASFYEPNNTTHWLFGSGDTAFTSTDISDPAAWTLQSGYTGVANCTITALAQNGTNVAGVGLGGCVLTSTDSLTTISATNLSTLDLLNPETSYNVPLYDVHYYDLSAGSGEKGFIAVGNTGHIFKNDDTLSGWTYVSQDLTTANLYTVTSDDTNIYIGGADGTFLTSSDAAGFTLEDSKSSRDFYKMYFYNEILIVAGLDRTLRLRRTTTDPLTSETTVNWVTVD